MPIMNYPQQIRDSINKESATITLPTDVVGIKISPSDPKAFEQVLRFLVACFCRHPRRILEEILQSGVAGIDETVKQLFSETLGTCANGESLPIKVKVWRGTIGEVLATAYVIGFTKYAVPVFKLRFAPNRRLAMHGEDLLGFQFTKSGEPSSLLVGEAKNWQSVASSVSEANKTLLIVKSGSLTLINFIIEELDAQGRHREAKMVQRFLDTYDFDYKKQYLAFVVSDEVSWKDEYYLKVNPTPATPLEIVAFTMPDCDKFQNSIVYNEHESQISSSANTNIDTSKDLQRLLDNTTFKNHHSRLASAALASSLEIEGREQIQYDLDARRIEMAAHFIIEATIRLSLEANELRKDLLYYAARMLERLATWELERGDKELAIRAIVNAAIYFSIAGYDANAKVLMETAKSIQVDDLASLSSIEKCAALFLSGKLAELEDEIAVAMFESLNYDTDVPKTEQEWFDLVGEAIANTADLLVCRAFALLLHYFREGNRELISRALEILRQATKSYSLIGEYESSHLSRILVLYFLNVAENAPFSILAKYIME